MRLFGCFLVLLTLATPSLGRAEKKAERIGADIRYLASDELEGRGVQTKGIRKAAEYIRTAFKEAGLKSGTPDGTYFQKFVVPLRDKQPSMPRKVFTINGPGGQEIKLEAGKNYQPLGFGGDGQAKGDLVFVGYGIAAPRMKYDDYKGADVKGKIVVMIRREPQQDDDKSVFSGKRTTSHSYVASKIDEAKRRGALGVILVNDPYSVKKAKKDSLARINQFSSPFQVGPDPKRLPFAQLTIETLNAILANSPIIDSEGQKLTTVADIETHINKNMKPLTRPLKGWRAEMDFAFVNARVEAENVVGVLPGKGSLKNETIVIGAHYDHLGYGGYGSRPPVKIGVVHNGADDNASGTAAVMELARRFGTRDKKPRRRIVFIAFSGEERGLIGSAHYCRKPLFPLKDTVAMINFDMIGMLRNNRLTVSGTSSAKPFGGLIRKATEGMDLTLLTPKGPPRGSDQVWFYRNKIPAVHFFTGSTKYYHRPEDDYDTLNVEGAAQVVDVCENFVSLLLESERPEFVPVQAAARPIRLPYLGIVPDVAASADADGVVIDDVTEGSPAAKTGFKPGDTIILFGKHQTPNLDALTKALGGHKPKDLVKVVVKRGKKKETIQVELGARR